MVQKFHEQFPYVSFFKDQIQDKEKELKRDFNLLKEACKQSGVHWDDNLCMIIADPPIWDNIIVVILFSHYILVLHIIPISLIFLTYSCILQSYPKASKFQRQAFPLYDVLEKLYGGKLSFLFDDILLLLLFLAWWISE
jgi:hypothetical protein